MRSWPEGWRWDGSELIGFIFRNGSVGMLLIVCIFLYGWGEQMGENGIEVNLRFFLMVWLICWLWCGEL